MAAWRETVVVVKPRDERLPDQRNVAVICTGGTLCMKPNEEGALEPVEGFLGERMLQMHEFKRPEMPACTLYELLPLLDSSDMGPEDWVRIADTIERLYYEYDGFVVVQGTDTMAYAASALSFMLESLGKSVILTGSMLPLFVLFNDAHRNLIVSIVMAATLDVPEVCIFMDDQLMRGNRTVKSNSSGLDAFESPNFPALAKLETGIRFRPNLVAPQPKGRFRVHRPLETNIGVWRMVPGFNDEYIRMAVQHCTDLKAIVLELYGTGNLSARKASLLDALETAVARGIVIVATSQCLRGSVNLSTYALGRRLEAIGVLSAFDMTTEAVVAKLAYLLAWPDMTRSLVKQYMGRSLRGEVTESLAAEEPQTGGAGAGVAGTAHGHSSPPMASQGPSARPGDGALHSNSQHHSYPHPHAGGGHVGEPERRISLPHAHPSHAQHYLSGQGSSSGSGSGVAALSSPAGPAGGGAGRAAAAGGGSGVASSSSGASSGAATTSRLGGASALAVPAVGPFSPGPSGLGTHGSSSNSGVGSGMPPPPPSPSWSLPRPLTSPASVRSSASAAQAAASAAMDSATELAKAMQALTAATATVAAAKPASS